jgi:hypothetical protein
MDAKLVCQIVGVALTDILVVACGEMCICGKNIQSMHTILQASCFKKTYFRVSGQNTPIRTHYTENKSVRSPCWGLPEKFGWFLKHEGEREFLARSSTQLEYRETVIPSADCTSSKKSGFVYTCPHAPLL